MDSGICEGAEKEEDEMSMKIVDGCKQIPEEKWFPMSEMKNGEVCYCDKTAQYVLKVYHYSHAPIFLILGDHEGSNQYGKECTHPVRRLRSGEYVTIEFYSEEADDECT